MVLGFASSIMRWGTQLLHTLALDQEVIIFDHNGQGLSRDLAPRLPVSIESITADVMDFIAKLQLQQRPNILVSGCPPHMQALPALGWLSRRQCAVLCCAPPHLELQTALHAALHK